MKAHGEQFAVKQRPLGISDQPVASRQDDTLSLSREAGALARFIASSVTPLTIAVQGDWGSGKTSLLRMIEEQLDPKQDGERVNSGNSIEVIRFETWQYAQFGGGPALPLSLLSMLARRLSPPGALSRVQNVVRNLAKPVANFALRYATGGATELDDYARGAGGIDFAEQCDDLRAELRNIVAAKLTGHTERIVVLIDDLDRVDPMLAIDILQTIKMFLDLEHCVFVLALDFAVVKEGVRKKFGIEEDAKARAFFDKIIQLPFQVPIAKYDTGGFVLRLLREMGDPDVGRDEATTLEALSRTSVSSNPRAIKRVMNSLHLTRLLAAEELDAMGERRAAAMVALFGLLCMQARFPDAYGWLLQQENAGLTVRALGLADPPAEAITAIGFAAESDRMAFLAFARIFAAAVEPLIAAGGDTFATVVGLTRSTSIGEQTSAYKFTPAMRSENRALMTQLLEECRAALPGVAIVESSPDGGGGVVLTATVAPGIQLSLEHSLTWLGLSVNKPIARQDEVLAALSPGARLASDRSIHIWDAGAMPTTPMWKRREYLKEGPRQFADAWRKLVAAGLAA